MLVMGLYLKQHNKQTDDEVLDHFGADAGEDSEDDGLLVDTLEQTRKSSSANRHSQIFGAPEDGSSPIGGALGILAGSMKSAVSFRVCPSMGSKGLQKSDLSLKLVYIK